MVEERNDVSLFDMDTDAIVNTVNCKGVMGKGIALEFKRRYPRSYCVYREACKDGKLRPGMVLYVPGTGGERNIIHFPTKDHWIAPARLKWIHDGLQYLSTHYQDWGLQSIAMPQLGCGFGGLNWHKVGPLVHDAFDDEPLEVVVSIFTVVQLEPREQVSAPQAEPQSQDASGRFPKRLIEVDLPIKRISTHARRKKSIRHGGKGGGEEDRNLFE